jgi:hypothetical protein
VDPIYVLHGANAAARRHPKISLVAFCVRVRIPLASLRCDNEVELYNQDCLEWLKAFNFYTAGRVPIYHLVETRTSQKRYKCGLSSLLKPSSFGAHSQFAISQPLLIINRIRAHLTKRKF